MASVSYYSASKLEPNVEEFNSEEMTTMQQLLFDFNYDVEHTFSDENQDCYFDPDEFILPVEMNNNSCFMPEYSVFEKQQKVFQDDFLPNSNIITLSTHNSCFNPEYSVFESTPKRQKVFQDDFLPNSNIITPSTHNSSFMPEYSVFESTPKRQKVFQDDFLPNSNIITLSTHNSCFNPEYSVFESTPKRQKVFQDDFLPNSNIITPSTHNSSFMPEYSVFESTPKRQKVFQDDFLPNSNIITRSTHNSSFMPEYSVYESTPKLQEVFQVPPQGLFNEGLVPNPPMFEDFASYSLPEIPMPVFSSNNTGVVAKKGGGNNNNEKKMSAQSIAARQRRKKISDKTQELGKLIPGGHRMNTAEMLQATFKYIKLLQAQAGLLQFMGSFQESFETSDLHKLVGSSLVQEKLYSSENCLVPKVFLEALENNQEFQNSQVLEEVKTLINFRK